ncbi:hypothetical protein BBF96_00580 [Anoxybacter fermentans]|uniref:Cas10/Cmr2 second palm domain-containing protein n=1 Tax=Anoxybacter fermentans TaxID=1323375 RepID=A0A3Q9HNG2_9FIRM|nr:hypothetical protein [Anoxybacter fermentans]AZR72031.1 hypothetical protein BBF96_00580 [Anoxybacter fermentans]
MGKGSVVELTPKERKFLLLTEVLGILHDIGKLAESIQKSTSNNGKVLLPFSVHILRPFYEWNLDKIERLKSRSGKYSQYKNSYHWISKDDLKFLTTNVENNDKDNSEKKDENEDEKKDFSHLNKEWNNLKIESSLVNKSEKIGLTALKHHFKYKDCIKPDSSLAYLIAQADNLDAYEDRSTDIDYDKGTDYVCNPFGGILEKEDRDKLRKEVYSKLGLFKESIKGIFEGILNLEGDDIDEISKLRCKFYNIAEEMNKAAAMSVVPDNDTTVWDHGFAVGSITKAMVRAIFLTEKLAKVDKSKANIYENFEKLRNLKCNKEENEKLALYLYLAEKKLDRDKIEKIMPENIKLEDVFAFEYNGSFKKENAKSDKIYANFFLIKSSEDSFTKKFRKTINEKINIKKYGFFQVQGNKTKFYVNFFKSGGAGWLDDEGQKVKVNVYDCLFGTPHILAVQYPGRDFCTQVFRMPDFIGRRTKLKKVLEKVKNLVEVEYSLGNCVYEDINGMYFLIPDLKNTGLEEDIKEKIHKIFAQEDLKGVILPRIKTTPCINESDTINFGKAIVKLKKEYEQSFKKRLAPYRVEKITDFEWIDEWKDENKGICPLCRKMPGTVKDKKYEREPICNWCNSIRENALENKDVNRNSKYRFASLINQVMDDNRNIALLVGDIGLFDLWLKGDYVYTTFNVRGKKKYSKTPSPSRLRSIIRNVNDFTGKLEEILTGDVNLRKRLMGITFKINNSIIDEFNLKTGFWIHKYDSNDLENLIKKHIKDDNKAQIFKEKLLKWQNGTFKILVQRKIDIGKDIVKCDTVYPENYFEGILKDDTKVREILEKILAEYFNKERKFEIEKSRIEKEKNEANSVEKMIKLTVKQSSIIRARVIYGLTDEFMILVPGREAIAILEKLYDIFKERFGRVQGRLSLNVGIVYARHKYPLYLILDAGKRMLKEFREALHRNKNVEIKCEIYEANIEKDEKKPEVTILTDGLEAEVLDISECGANNEFKKIKIRFSDPLFKDKELNIKIPEKILLRKKEQNEKEILDDFYPIWIVIKNNNDKGNNDNEENSKKLKLMRNSSNKNSDEDYAVLEAGDTILYAPSLVDFQFLSTVNDRINIALTKEGNNSWEKRIHTIRPLKLRPYLMEEFLALIEINKKIDERKIPASGLKNLETLLAGEINRFFKNYAEWHSGQKGQLMNNIVSAMVANISKLDRYFKDGEKIDEKAREEFYQILKDGRFFDLMELRTFIEAF